MLPRLSPVALDESSRPFLLVVVDTEEEFDWGAPLSRANTSVKAMRHVGRANRVFERYGLRPTYVIDYPVAVQCEGAEPLQELLGRDACLIGAHVHPWVNPPHDEVLSAETSFICNLPRDLQASKIQVLSDAIANRFGRRPRVFKAGRYGVGTTTIDLLAGMGFHVDTSVSPAMDFSSQAGPSFVAYDSRPFFLTTELLELPCTIDYVGWTGRTGRMIHALASRPPLERLRAPGILARMGAVNKVMLSPEGNTVNEMCALVRHLHRQGLRVFTLSYHSPSLEPGHTPYVRTSQDLDRFLDCLDCFCEFFMTEMRGIATTAEELRQHIMSERRS